MTRRLIMDLVCIVIYESEYSIAFNSDPALTSYSVTQVTRRPQPLFLSPILHTRTKWRLIGRGMHTMTSSNSLDPELRHTYATLLKGNGEDVKVVQEFMGMQTSRSL